MVSSLRIDCWDKLERNFRRLGMPERLTLGRNIVLFGVGIYGQIAMQYFTANGTTVYYCDNDPAKQGKLIDGLKVISPKEIPSLKNPLVFITARHYVMDVTKQLSEMDIECISYDAYFVNLLWDKYREVYDNLLDDPRSKEVYLAVLGTMLSGSKDFCRNVMEENAFWAIPEFSNNGNDIFIDAGAYVGDTVEQFIWKNIGAFKKIYAFEPGERQFNAMQYRIKRLVVEWDIAPDKIVCINAGLGETDSLMSFNYNRLTPLNSSFISSSDLANTTEATIHALDSYLGGEAVTLIKSDIEGFEMKMLKGAAKTIKRFRPKLAISIYHKPQDLFEVPLYIKSLVPEYKLAIRHHAPTLVDTVLYCWI